MTQIPATTIDIPKLDPASPDLTLNRIVDEKIVLCYFTGSLAWLMMAMLVGFFYSLQFLQFYPFAGIEIMSPGRLRFVHTNMIAYGFIANAFLGALHWAIPRLTLRPVLNRKLSWFILVVWQVIVLTTLIGLIVGHLRAIGWNELPTYVSLLAMLGIILMAINFLIPIFLINGPKHISLWYFITAFIWMVTVYVMDFLSLRHASGIPTPGANFGPFIHEMAGLYVTPLGWGLMYYFLPFILKKPIWSHKLSLVGFWGLLLFFPLSHTYYYRYSSILLFQQYGFLQYVPLIATIAIELVVATLIINFFFTIKNHGSTLKTNPPMRWFFIGMVFYATSYLQSAIQAILTLQKIAHFSDWVVGQSHLVMFGVFGFWMLGIMTHVLPRLLGATGWYRPSWNAWHFWLTAAGLLIMFIDLVVAGMIQSNLLRDLAPWETMIIASKPFWLIRTLAGVVIIVGQLPFMYNILMTAVHKYTVEPLSSFEYVNSSSPEMTAQEIEFSKK